MKAVACWGVAGWVCWWGVGAVVVRLEKSIGGRVLAIGFPSRWRGVVGAVGRAYGAEKG